MTDTSRTAATDTAAEVVFAPPGPGSWMLDTTHHGTRPLTRFMWPSYRRAFEQGMAEMMKRYGLPLSGGLVGNVHGLVYIRILAVGEKPGSAGKPPPEFVLKIVSRLHPELRRRAKTAAAALDNKTWRQDVTWWFDEQRERAVEANLALQGVDLVGLDDSMLGAHVSEAAGNFDELALRSFANHGGDIVPVGLFLSACAQWGIGADEASAALRGASPATLETARLLAPVGSAIARCASPPTSVDEVRSLGSDAAAAVDEWLRLHSWRLLSSDDIDSPTMAEKPETQLRALIAARPDQVAAGAPDTEDLRQRVPVGDRHRFDDLLGEARHGLTQRDDAVALAWNWPAGLIRRSLLEVGRRLVERGLAHDVEHALELDQTEVVSVLAGAGPTADVLDERRRFRDMIEHAHPPTSFGADSGPPSLDAFPRPLATMAAAVLAMVDAMEHSDASAELTGTGVGTGVYRGRACVVRSPVDAVDDLEPGDVLVAPFTSPSYNAVFPMVGALVTDHGGPMSHTAIMAREFDVPAVVGTVDGTSRIPHGATVEVDAASASVRIVT